ncbi:hypothetical protein EON68_05025 [archaeon]|nr:MAG: hypothetical protein EON68_05025 [archaeon]
MPPPLLPRPPPPRSRARQHTSTLATARCAGLPPLSAFSAMRRLAAPARAPSVRQRGLHTLLLGVGLFVAHLTRSAHAAPQTWNIACITSLTGILNATGTRIAAGARLFEQEFNAAG